MMNPTLVIANKAYSSWSLRPWLLLRYFGIAFDEICIPLRMASTHEDILRYSPSGKVPVLIDGAFTVWDSLAIIEYCAERYPECAIWPEDTQKRAVARAVSAEMHSSFQGLRSQCIMNVRRVPRPLAFTPETLADMARIEAIWASTRARFGGQGAFLFGDFCAADAMYAPVVSRFHVYDMPVSADTREYMSAVMALPEWREWAQGAAAETWVVPALEKES